MNILNRIKKETNTTVLFFIENEFIKIGSERKSNVYEFFRSTNPSLGSRSCAEFKPL
jgi:hypothetical protein